MESTSVFEGEKDFFELLAKTAVCHSSVRAWALHLHSVILPNAFLFFNDVSPLIVEVNCLLGKAIVQNTLSEDSFLLLEILQRIIEKNKGTLRDYLERFPINQKISETKQEFSPQKKFFPLFEQYCQEHQERSKHGNASAFYSSLSDELRMEIGKTWKTFESFYTAYKNRNQQTRKRQQRLSEREKQFVGLPEEALNRLQQWLEDR